MILWEQLLTPLHTVVLRLSSMGKFSAFFVLIIFFSFTIGLAPDNLHQYPSGATSTDDACDYRNAAAFKAAKYRDRVPAESGNATRFDCKWDDEIMVGNCMCSC